MEELSIDYFRNLWKTNVEDLESLCGIWESICNDTTIPDEVLGEIRTVVGLARLLMRQKLHQFKGLIDDSESKTGEKEITCLDLQGFWDMVYNEVEKIQKDFVKLQNCKSNDWKLVEETSVKPIKKKVPVQNVSNKKTDTAKSHSLAARQRLAEVKKKMLAQQEKQEKEALVEIIQPLKDNTNHINGEIVNNVSSGIVQLKNGGNGDLRCSPRIQKMATTSADTAATKKKSSLKVPLKANNDDQQNIETTPLQNKENVLQGDLSFTTQTKSKELTEILHKKSKGKSKEFGKLQCLTRSAKKALMAQQNTV